MVFAIFCVLSVFMVFSAILVVSCNNSVYSVLSLILTFVLSSGIFILLGAEFIAMLVIVVYVGAVAVLFLFVVMMINVDSPRSDKDRYGFFMRALILSAVFLCSTSFIVVMSYCYNANQNAFFLKNIHNVVQIGNLIYTKYMYLFHLSGMLLLVAIIGSLVLTLSHRKVRRQNISSQIKRSSLIKLVNVKVGEGIDDSFN